MLETVAFTILKMLATSCIRFYLGSLMSGGQIDYKSADLGYKVPKWYMNPGKPHKALYAYGTSISGDEFDSLVDAKHKAVEQMATHIRLGNRNLIEKTVRYDASSVKQKRLIELFLRGEGLETFVQMKGRIDKKQLVRVTTPQRDIRAFVRLKLAAKDYVDYQQKVITDLKRRLTQQKTEDIMDEMEAELAAWEKEEEGALQPIVIPPPAPEPGPDGVEPGAGEPPEPPPPPAPAPAGSSPFSDLESELDSSL